MISIRKFLAGHPAGAVAVDCSGDLWCVIGGALHWLDASGDVVGDMADGWMDWGFADDSGYGPLRIIPGLRYAGEASDV